MSPRVLSRVGYCLAQVLIQHACLAVLHDVDRFGHGIRCEVCCQFLTELLSGKGHVRELSSKSFEVGTVPLPHISNQADRD